VPHSLESSGTDADPQWDSLYLYRGDEVVEHRPVFTGDVFVDVQALGENAPRCVIVVQHPCAIRKGTALAKNLLVAEVSAHQVIKPSKWSGNYKVMPLPELDPQKLAAAAKFDSLFLVTGDSLGEGRRIACLSQIGVNLLLQRWVHHNSRVVVPTTTYQAVNEAQFEEADIIENWCTDRADDAVELSDAAAEIDAFLSSTSIESGMPNRQLLVVPQKRTTVRRQVRTHLRSVRGK
jgi:hypothetical protein